VVTFIDPFHPSDGIDINLQGAPGRFGFF